MKHIITLFAILVATATGVYAQTDSLVIFDTKGDNLGISIAGFNISIGGNDREEYTDEYIYHEPRRKKIATNFLGLGFGGMVLTSSPYYGPWEGEKDILDIYPASSTRIDLEIVSWNIPLDLRGRFYYRVGTMFSYDSYAFRNNITMFNDDEGYLMPAPLDGQIKYTRLKANYWGLNMGFGFKVNKVMIMIQGTAELLTKSSVKYKNPQKSVYTINGVSPFRSRISMSTSWDGYGFYIDYALTPLFEAGTGNDAHSLSLGVRMGF